MREPRPQARRHKMIVRKLGQELLLYDRQRHRAFYLNPTAAWVYEHADGQRTLAALSRELEHAFDLPAGEGLPLVRLAVNRLARARLVEDARLFLEMPSPSRREVMVRLGKLGLSVGLAVMLPTVRALVAPTAAQVATCISSTQCSKRRPPRCGGTRCCTQQELYCQAMFIDLPPRPRVICACCPPDGCP